MSKFLVRVLSTVGMICCLTVGSVDAVEIEVYGFTAGAGPQYGCLYIYGPLGCPSGVTSPPLYAEMRKSYSGGQHSYLDYAAVTIGEAYGDVRSLVVVDNGSIHMIAHSLPPITTVLEDGHIIGLDNGFSYMTVQFSEGVHLLGDIPEPLTAYMTVRMFGHFAGVSTYTEAIFQAPGYSGYVQVNSSVTGLVGGTYFPPFFTYNYYNNDCPDLSLNPNEVCREGPLINETIVIPFTISNDSRDFTIRNGFTVQAALGAAVDLSHTASMGLILPPGVTFTSDSGIFLTQPSDDQSFTTPIANAGSDQTVNEGDPVTLNGSGSTDPLSLPLTFAWTQVAGPTITLDLSDPVHPTFVAPNVPASGMTLSFQLVVSDGDLTSIPAIVNITVKNVNHPPVFGDLDDDGDVDQADINILLLNRNKSVSQSTCGTPCDLDNDGKITVLDARKLQQLCTRPRCATH